MKHLVLSLFCVLTWQIHTPAQCPDRTALLELYNALRADGPWFQNGNQIDWDTAQTDCCNGSYYYGVFCDPEGNIIGIDLDGDAKNTASFINNCTLNSHMISLSGQLPTPFNFPKLRLLSLSKGSISGPLPDFSSSTALTELYINCNEINGPIIIDRLPSEIIKLSIERNKINGPFPNIDQRPNLVSVNLANNQLEGSIPAFTQVFNLQYLLLNYNNLSGIIPGFTVTQLKELDLQYNRFTFKDMLRNYADLRKHNVKLESQQPVTPPASVTLPIGGDWVWSLGDVDDTVTTNTYYWIHGNDTLPPTYTNTLRKEVEQGDEGMWICKITNSIVQGVVLESGPVTVTLCDPERDNIDTALCPGQSLVVRGVTFDRNNPRGKIQIPGAANNGCDSLYVVNIQYPDRLAAGPDTLVCDDATPLRAVLPAGYQGRWLTLDGGTVEQPEEPVTRAIKLAEGLNRFVWKTESPDCPDGDSDTVSVMFDRPPIAMDTLFRIYIDKDLMGNFKFNDLFDPVYDFMEVLPLPAGGEFLFDDDGNFTFDPDRLYLGTYRAQYRLCSDNCPLIYCDIAEVAIQVVPESQPTFVTPNGDGENDVFVVEELAADADALPNNRLVIWTDTGEVILNQCPYRNNWPPQNTLLPKVYYYRFFRDEADREGRPGTILIWY